MDRSGFRVEVTRAAEKDLRALSDTLALAVQMLATLESGPGSRRSTAGERPSGKGAPLNRGRREFRTAYVVLPEAQVCLVFLVGTPENFYREVARRLAAAELAVERDDLPRPEPEG
jgi:hypothetical protein